MTQQRKTSKTRNEELVASGKLQVLKSTECRDRGNLQAYLAEEF